MSARGLPSTGCRSGQTAPLQLTIEQVAIFFRSTSVHVSDPTVVGGLVVELKSTGNPKPFRDVIRIQTSSIGEVSSVDS